MKFNKISIGVLRNAESGSDCSCFSVTCVSEQPSFLFIIIIITIITIIIIIIIIITIVVVVVVVVVAVVIIFFLALHSQNLK